VPADIPCSAREGGRARRRCPSTTGRFSAPGAGSHGGGDCVAATNAQRTAGSRPAGPGFGDGGRNRPAPAALLRPWHASRTRVLQSAVSGSLIKSSEMATEQVRCVSRLAAATRPAKWIACGRPPCPRRAVPLGDRPARACGTHLDCDGDQLLRAGGRRIRPVR
jgi:hypothetical protein